MGAHFRAIRPWKLFSFGEFSLPAYALRAGSDSEDARYPVNQPRSAHIFITSVIGFSWLVTVAMSIQPTVVAAKAW